MRPKEIRVIVTFHTTTQAMAFEKEARLQEIPGRLIPVPQIISAGCGLSYSAPTRSESDVRELAERMGCQEIHVVEI